MFNPGRGFKRLGILQMYVIHGWLLFGWYQKSQNVDALNLTWKLRDRLGVLDKSFWGFHKLDSAPGLWGLSKTYLNYNNNSAILQKCSNIYLQPIKNKNELWWWLLIKNSIIFSQIISLLGLDDGHIFLNAFKIVLF